jgi:uncharacterized protein
MNIREIVFSGKVGELVEMLNANPALASEEISLPGNPAKAHPLHRICDAVFMGNYSEAVGFELAKTFIRYGADVNAEKHPQKDTPLTAACSLRCDQLALYYIDLGARIGHPGCHGGTALHWAAWCGRDVVVKKLLEMNPDINQLCVDFKSTPLCWAAHGRTFGGKDNRHHQLECAQLLLAHGADASIPTFEGYLPVQLLNKDDFEFRKLFEKPN